MVACPVASDLPLAEYEAKAMARAFRRRCDFSVSSYEVEEALTPFSAVVSRNFKPPPRYLIVVLHPVPTADRTPLGPLDKF
jgi:hypothetical protein